MTPPSGAQRFPAFGSYRFRLFFAGHMFANVGAWMEIVATGWLVLELTDSPAALGLNAALQAVPVIALSLVGGMVADRMDRYQLILRTQGARLVLSTAMAVLVGSGQVQVWHIYVYSVLSSMVSGLTVPPRQALVPRLVPPEALLSAMALNSVLWQGAPILGPSLAGLILAFSGIAGCFYANVAGEVINLAAMFGLRLAAEEPKEAKGSLWLTLTEGLHYAWADERVRTPLLAIALLSLFGRAHVSIMPVFARDVFAVGPQGLGVMLTMPALGTLAAGALMGAFASVATGRRFLATSVASGLALAAFGLSPNFLMALICLVVSGGLSTACTTLANTLIQEQVKDRFRGRVMSYVMATSWGGWRLGALPVAMGVPLVGAPIAVALAGALLIVSLLPLGLHRKEFAEERGGELVNPRRS